jgi:hypothetical protein
VSASARVSKDVNQAVVIASCDQTAILRKVDSVDVGTVCARWEDAVNQPAILGMPSCPISSDSVRGSTWILLEVVSGEEEELMSTADTPDVLSILTPVD